VVEPYDLLNRVLSLGLDRRWRRVAAGAAGVVPGDRVLDLGCGTGDLARLLVDRATVVGADLSHRMLLAARAKVGPAMRLVEASAFRLPFNDATFDAVVSAFVLRNLDDLSRAFEELARVLRPGGRVALLDITEPRSAILRPLFRLYFSLAAPALGAAVGRAEAYRYLARSVGQVPAADRVCELLERAGLSRAAARPLSGGVVTLFVATRAEPRR
jgi:demethylmenaquinone methyltransferase/2-methoxy-6-polyprenyl-1,4-benzoquinol methylase